MQVTNACRLGYLQWGEGHTTPKPVSHLSFLFLDPWELEQNVKRYTLKITRVIAIFMEPTSLRQELLWVNIFLFRPVTVRPSTEP